VIKIAFIWFKLYYNAVMVGLHPVESHKNKVNQNRLDRTAKSIAEVIAGANKEEAFLFTINRGHLVLSSEVMALAGRVTEELVELGVKDFVFDLPASQEAGQTNENCGYGNYAARSWGDNVTLVFGRQQAQEAGGELHVLKPHTTPPVPAPGEHLAAA
jgi:hypothetical protein